MSYFPLDRDVLTSSLWAEGSPEAIKVWIYLLLQANPRTGIVDDAAPAIALRCGLSLPVTLQALDWLSSPDPHSRTKEAGGRRVEALEDGRYRLINYLRRRDKDHSTQRVRRYRDRMKRCETVGNGSETVSGTTNTNTETTEGRKEPPLPPPPEQRAENATKDTIHSLQLRLGGLLARCSEHPNSRLMVPAWCQRVSSYDKAGGAHVKGRSDYRTIDSIERLEKSIGDAEWYLGEMDKGVVYGA